MAGASSRRPIPALIFLVALLLLSGLVWWRVLNRDDSTAKPTPPTGTTSCTPRSKPVALPKPAAVTVNVLNATNTSGLAKTVTDKLRSRGFKVGIPNNDTGTSALSYIRYGPKAAAAARLVQIYVPNSLLTPNTGTSAVIVLSVGATFKDLTGAVQVTKALAVANKVIVKTC